MSSTVLVLIIVVVVLGVAVATLAVMVSRRNRSARLQKHFGTEYERTISDTGDRKQGEAELRGRQQRRSELDIRELRPEERNRFQESWNSVQREFVDDPTRAMNDADKLVVELMRARGYPVEDFDRRADDISVDHPDVVRHYREARSVRDDSAGGSVDTELQRRALTSYRSLIEALLGRDRAERPNSHTAHREDADRRTSDTTTTQRRSQ